MSLERNFITSKTQCNAVNACGNGLWQLGFNLFQTFKVFHIGLTPDLPCLFAWNQLALSGKKSLRENKKSETEFAYFYIFNFSAQEEEEVI